MRAAHSELSTLTNYMRANISPVLESSIVITRCNRQAEDAERLMRLQCSNLMSKVVTSFQKIKTNLGATLPEYWRSYTLTRRNDDQILVRIVKNSALDVLLPRRTALSRSLEVFKPIALEFESMARTGCSHAPGSPNTKVAPPRGRLLASPTAVLRCSRN